jgi:hypothetical protein
MKLAIITADNAVYKDNVCYADLDLGTCGIPANVWALQWQGTTGWIEDKSALVDNSAITELPAWANACLVKWDEEAARLAAEETARLAAEEAIRLAAEETANLATEETARLAAEEAAQNTPQ